MSMILLVVIGAVLYVGIELLVLFIGDVDQSPQEKADDKQENLP